MIDKEIQNRMAKNPATKIINSQIAEFDRINKIDRKKAKEQASKHPAAASKENEKPSKDKDQ